MVTLRFTPTGVGTIRAADSRARSRAVHPHGRGDNCLAEGDMVAPDGSPPRAWGQSVEITDKAISSRFTPTGVGTIETST